MKFFVSKEKNQNQEIMIPLIEKFCTFFIAFLSLNLSAQTEAFEVKITGNGDQSLVFIPGLASSGKVFEETRSEFEDNFTIYTFTLAGFAGVPPMENPSFEVWEKAVVDYLRENKIKNPIIVGHSLGGAMAMAIAADYPKLPKKIVVIDALPYLVELNPNLSEEKIDCETMVSTMTSVSEEEFISSQKRNIQYMVADSAKQSVVLQWSLDSDRETVAKIFCNYMKLDLRKKLEKITAPTLVLLEPYFKNSEPVLEKQFMNLQPLTLKYAPKGRHFLMYGAKEWLLTELHAFIDQQ